MPEEPTTTGHKVNNIKASDFKSVYSNNVEMRTAYFDTVFIFGEVQGLEDNVLTVEQKLRVVMTPPQTKIFLLLLTQQVHSYEEKFGPIKIERDMVTPELLPFLERYNQSREKQDEG